jgi:hypothetical protein
MNFFNASTRGDSDGNWVTVNGEACIMFQDTPMPVFQSTSRDFADSEVEPCLRIMVEDLSTGEYYIAVRLPEQINQVVDMVETDPDAGVSEQDEFDHLFQLDQHDPYVLPDTLPV